MQLTREALLDRVATEVASAGPAWVTGLDPSELQARLAEGVPVDAFHATAAAHARALLVVSARAVAADGSVSPTGPRESWPTVDACAGGARAIAVVLPEPGAPLDPTAAGAALVAVLEPNDAVSLCVSKVLTAAAVLELDDEGFIVTELAKDLSAAQLQQSVEPTLRISPAVSEMASGGQLERA